MMANTSSENATHLLQRYLTIADIMEEFAPVAFAVERIVPPFWYFIGFIGNPLSAYIWLGQRMRKNNSSAVYLGALAIFDMVFLFLHLMYILQNAWGHDLYNAHYSCEMFQIFFYAPQYLSTFFVLGFTTERYVAVCFPFLKEMICTVRRALMIVAALVLFSFALASIQGYIWAYHEGSGICTIRGEAMAGGDLSFWNVWSWTTDIFAFILIPLLVLVFNILVLRIILKISKNEVMKRQNSRSNSSTASTVTLMSVSFYLILTQVSATIVGLLQQAFPMGEGFLSDDEIRRDSTWASFFTYLEVRKVTEVICLSHYACYFFIYCCTGKHFRKEVIYMLTFHGRLSFFTTLFSKKKQKERYSMVSTNGGIVSDTYATNVTTSI